MGAREAVGDEGQDGEAEDGDGGEGGGAVGRAVSPEEEVFADALEVICEPGGVLV